ncbi:type IV pilus biogenesis protein PilP [Roseibium sp. RKSG952]|uniref:type IV pilus biogenesis protein PilP n=1 Tax=Roseibium sp. RKSG952 TaxID=2529384 RepID=UPI0012BD25AB|nr:type IV pilus biogenesis protein PilP [Roseibium sp. RKSG952]MTH97583.1 type IV pilus biogenesis protein PilP [Roseibium sp. RKSG952]
MNNFRFLGLGLAKIAAVTTVSSLALGSFANAQSAFPAQDSQPSLAMPGTVQQQPAIAPLPSGLTAGEVGKTARDLSAEASDLLKNFSKGSLAPAEATDIEEISRQKREIQRLEHELKKVELNAEIYEILNPNQTENDARVEDLENEVERLQAELIAAEEAPIVIEQKDPPPVVSEVLGAAGRMEAKILVPYMGEVIARHGTVLPNGMKVTSITSSGVRVMDGDKSLPLAFGTKVPSVRPMVTSVQR